MFSVRFHNVSLPGVVFLNVRSESPTMSTSMKDSMESASSLVRLSAQAFAPRTYVERLSP